MKKSEHSLQEKRDFAANMRRNPTAAEKTLWWKLSRNQFNYRFCRQFPLRGYIVDFYCSRLRLVIEVDGSVHEQEDVAADDEQRERILESYGYLVLRFSNEDVLDHLTVVLSRIWDECSARRAALKAFASEQGLGKEVQEESRVSRPCGSLENSAPTAKVEDWSGLKAVLSHPENLCRPSEIPADQRMTLETAEAIVRAASNLVTCDRQRSLAFQADLRSAAECAFDQKHRLAWYLHNKRPDLITSDELRETVKKLCHGEDAALTISGMHVTEPSRRKA